MVISETNSNSDNRIFRSIDLLLLFPVSLGYCLSDNFFHRGHTLPNLIYSGFAQRDHPVFNRLLSQLESRGANQNQLSYLVRYFHHLIESDAAFVAGVVAGAATRSFVCLDLARLI